jgi:hypothetical protein
MNSGNNLRNIITSFTLYKFLDTLTMPFIKTEAYRLGIIDAAGNLLKDVNKLNPTEKSAYNEFYQLVFSLKKLLLKVPDPSVRANLSSVISSLRLISEQCEFLGGDGNQFVQRALRELDACRLITEEGEGGAVTASAPTNSVSSGGIYGLKPEETTFLSKKGQKKHISTNSIFKRKKPNTYYNDKNNSY